MSSTWKNRKRSGYFRKKIKLNYNRILSGTVTSEHTQNNSDVEESANRNLNTNNDSSSGSSAGFSNVLEPINDNDDNTILSEISKNCRTVEQIRSWAVSFNINHAALTELLKIFNERIPNILPNDPRTLLYTIRKVNLIKMQDGVYWHHGLKCNLQTVLENTKTALKVINLNINVDGLPIYKSSRNEFWPILCNIQEMLHIKPIVVGIYSGPGKPADKAYLQAFVDEAKQLLAEGIFVKVNGETRYIQIKIRCFICDSPARAFIKGKLNFCFSVCKYVTL